MHFPPEYMCTASAGPYEMTNSNPFNATGR